jgi:tetratricopeptide (TPR) repeat protein
VVAIAAEGWVQYYAGEYPAALQVLGRALERNPDYALTHLWRAWVLEEMDSLPAALDAHRRAVAASDSGAVFVAAQGRALALAGDRAGAEALLRKLESRGRSGGYVPSYEIAKIYEALGQRDRALEWLERAYRQRSHSMVFLKVDPQLRGLRSDPRFIALVERVGMK